MQKWYHGRFEAFEKNLNGEASTNLHAIRRTALATFKELGFPTTKHEEWRFTNVKPIATREFQPATRTQSGVSADSIRPFSFSTPNRLVFVNGLFARELSSAGPLQKGMVVDSLSSAIKKNAAMVEQHVARYAPFGDNAFTALNTAFVRDGAFVVIPDAQRLEDPIHLLFLASQADGLMIGPRNVVVVGKAAQCSLVESYGSLDDGTYFTNAVTEMTLDEDAVIEHDKLQNEGLQAYHVASVHVHQKRRSNYTSNSISLGGSITRNNLTVVLDAEDCEATLNGLSLGTGSQLMDNHTVIDHAKPHCASHEVYKAVLDGKSQGVFNGKIFVRQDAQKTDAKQTNKTLLLSDSARMDTKPQLEIFADDVKCTHGATVGQLDEEQVFYLRSRGIDETTARDMLTFAFASDVVRRIHNEALRSQLESLVHAKLGEGRKAS